MFNVLAGRDVCVEKRPEEIVEIGEASLIDPTEVMDNRFARYFSDKRHTAERVIVQVAESSSTDFSPRP